ncbi:sulfatase family protein [Marinoscillum furvescens]|uniref:N-sulfoglucosamine sulfohydrolase n=1 Tax=Marinoscillum furvescens DSM 4134 TaxID=1122208 RepID=A0A3D9L2B0_MARFU|nr:sulfatase [Marinoscillum furvescens]RED98359.1 N-sulfoglucosamine sulfohydrolase [Marinoscillum furvescens DSM 4134]
MKRIQRPIIFTVFIFFILKLVSCSQQPENRKPNFVLLLTDDQSYHLGMLGVPGLKTPNIDALAQKGTFFTKAYASAASCAPSRGSILTGMYPHSNGHWRNTVTPGLNAPDVDFTRNGSKIDKVGVHEDIPTLIEVLKQNGYFTGITEKWHLSPVWKFPFDFRDKANLKPSGSAQAMKDFITAANGKPFFIQANVDNTHRPFQSHIKINKELPRVHADSVELPPHWPNTPKTRQDYAEYLTTVQHADSVIGAIIQTVKDAGLLDNTIFIYSSDQGFCYHRAKATAYDWGVHVPLSITGPGILSNQISEDLIGHVDIMPTVLDFAGLDIPQTVQGLSLRPILEGKSKTLGRKYMVSEHNAHGPAPKEYYPTRSITDGKYRLMWNINYQNVPKVDIDSYATAENARKQPRALAWMPWDATPSDAWQNNAFEEIIFHKDEYPLAYKLLKNSMFRTEFELYDLENDPHETRNLSLNPEFSFKVDQMKAALTNWMQVTNDIGDPRSIPRRQ